MDRVEDAPPSVDAVELAYNVGWTTGIRVVSEIVAYVVGPSRRGMLRRASADVIRSMGTLRRLLKDGDIVVTSHRKPYAVIVPIDEYERLTGRNLNTEET